MLAKWGKNEGVRVREVFKNKFEKVFRTVNLKFADPLDFRIVCELVLGVRNGI